MIKPVNYEPSQHFGDHPTSALPADHWLIQRFGNYQPDGHTGIDYPCPAGTPVKAVADGTVLHVGWFGGTYLDNPYWIAPGFAGYCYVVDHGDFVGIYAHCLEGGARVKVGQRVSEGQVLGPSGNTGGSTGDHLHFEVLPNGWIVNSRMYGRINPANILARVSTQSTTIETPKPEGFLMALNDQQQKDLYDRVMTYVDAPISAVDDKVWATPVTRGGKKISAIQELADAKTEALALRAAVVALAKNPGLNADQITAAVKAGIADGTVTVDVNVNQ
jgi:hypothetical protein